MKSGTLTPEEFRRLLVYEHCISFLLQHPLGNRKLTEESIKEIFLEADIHKPDWVKIAKGLGFQLRSQHSVTYFLEGWCTSAHSSELSWENLAFAMNKTTEYRSVMGKIQSKAGMERMLCVLMFPWQFIAHEIPAS